MYYFAYGSNINTNILNTYVDNVDVLGSAYINNYIFRYRNINTSKLRSGVANIENRKNSKTYGIIYYIHDNIDKLDKKEGCINSDNKYNKYNKILIEAILLKNNKKINCFAYQINDCYKSYQRKPRIEYFNSIKDGSKMHDLPKEHLNRLNYIFT